MGAVKRGILNNGLMRKGLSELTGKAHALFVMTTMICDIVINGCTNALRPHNYINDNEIFDVCVVWLLRVIHPKIINR